jgi:hypothetical protein
MFFDHLRAIGLPPSAGILVAVGWFEIVLGLVIAVRPLPLLVWLAFFWKLFTESLYAFAGEPIDVFETIERWGDYGIPIALLLILNRARVERRSSVCAAGPHDRAETRKGIPLSIPARSCGSKVN